MSTDKPDPTQARQLTEAAKSKLAELLEPGASTASIICVHRPDKGGELWYYDTETDEWIAPCVC